MRPRAVIRFVCLLWSDSRLPHPKKPYARIHVQRQRNTHVHIEAACTYTYTYAYTCAYTNTCTSPYTYTCGAWSIFLATTVSTLILFLKEEILTSTRRRRRTTRRSRRRNSRIATNSRSKQQQQLQPRQQQAAATADMSRLSEQRRANVTSCCLLAEQLLCSNLQVPLDNQVTWSHEFYRMSMVIPPMHPKLPQQSMLANINTSPVDQDPKSWCLQAKSGVWHTSLETARVAPDRLAVGLGRGLLIGWG